MTKGLIKSCQTRDKLLRNLIKNKVNKNSPASCRFRKYRNLLTSLIRKQKKKHYNEAFEKHKGDIKKTLELMKDLVNKSNDKHSITSTRFNMNGNWIEDDTENANASTSSSQK